MYMKIVIILGIFIEYPTRLVLDLVRWPNCLITYRSGQRVRIFLKHIKTKSDGGTLTSVEWDSIGPKPIHLGINDVESIYWLR